jgi:GT2 family glycosyltransferase
MRSPTASVVLCVRNGERTLARQLSALGRQEDATAWELVIVDNGSTDRTRDVIARLRAELPGALLVLDEARVGLNFARNRGIRAAAGARIMLCDADDEVSPQWLCTMVDALDRHDVVGGALDTERLNDPLIRPPSHNQATELPRVAGHRYAVGANIGFRRSVWTAIGGFDERFAGGYDDTDFCLRAQDAGFTIGFEPSAVVHYRLRDRLDHLARQYFHYGRGEERFVAKHRDGLGGGELRVRWRNVTADVRNQLAAAPAMLASRDERRRCLEQSAYLAGRLVELGRVSTAGRAPRRRPEAERPSVAVDGLEPRIGRRVAPVAAAVGEHRGGEQRRRVLRRLPVVVADPVVACDERDAGQSRVVRRGHVDDRR